METTDIKFPVINTGASGTSSPRDWTNGGGVKIERAKEHVVEFEKARRAFLEANPYVAVGQFDPGSTMVIFVIRDCPTVPARLAAITADALQNLRAVLDILWRQARGVSSSTRKEYFPLVRSAKELEPRFRSAKQAHHKAAANILRAIDNSEWRKLSILNEVNVRDKHEMPILAAATYKKATIRFPVDVVLDGNREVSIECASTGFLFLKSGASLPAGIRVMTDQGPVTDLQCELTADIAFGEGEILQGEPVLETLHETSRIVDGIVNAFLVENLVR